MQKVTIVIASLLAVILSQNIRCHSLLSRILFCLGRPSKPLSKNYGTSNNLSSVTSARFIGQEDTDILDGVIPCDMDRLVAGMLAQRLSDVHQFGLLKK